MAHYDEGGRDHHESSYKDYFLLMRTMKNSLAKVHIVCLCTIEETGSLRSAAASMGLAYTKALRMIQQCGKGTRISADLAQHRRKIRWGKHTYAGRKGMAEKI